MTSRALVALSGGLDSSYSLNLSLERYSAVRAGYVDTAGNGIPSEVQNTADTAGVELVRVDAASRFRSEVIGWSERMLAEGLTPNPCARCNARIKLRMLHEMLKPSETLVTGHYARKDGDLVCRGFDQGKDQSYFLSLVEHGILKDCTFPLGGMLKENVRVKARKLNIPFIESESMDLCFSIPAFESRPGRVLDLRGIEVGRHNGIENYTVGQRKGLGAFGSRMYVVSINSVEGTVTIGKREALLSTGCTVIEMNWFARPSVFPFKALVQTRYRRKAASADIDYINECMHIEFDQPEEAVAPGQVCAVYVNTSLIGGGLISSTEQLDWNRDEQRNCQ